MTDELLVPVSYGELLDKIAILQIKSERMTDPAKLAKMMRCRRSIGFARIGGLGVTRFSDGFHPHHARRPNVVSSKFFWEKNLKLTTLGHHLSRLAFDRALRPSFHWWVRSELRTG